MSTLKLITSGGFPGDPPRLWVTPKQYCLLRRLQNCCWRPMLGAIDTRRWLIGCRVVLGDAVVDALLGELYRAGAHECVLEVLKPCYEEAELLPLKTQPWGTSYILHSEETQGFRVAETEPPVPEDRLCDACHQPMYLQSDQLFCPWCDRSYILHEDNARTEIPRDHPYRL